MKNNKGFELIEFMIVCTIVGILLSIIVPEYQKYQANKPFAGSSITHENIRK